MLFKIDTINFSHEQSEPLAAFRARIVPYNPFVFAPSMEVSAGCNPSRLAIYSHLNHPLTGIFAPDPRTISRRGEGIESPFNSPFSAPLSFTTGI
jgi:hypothetical protein